MRRDRLWNIVSWAAAGAVALVWATGWVSLWVGVPVLVVLILMSRVVAKKAFPNLPNKGSVGMDEAMDDLVLQGEPKSAWAAQTRREVMMCMWFLAASIVLGILAIVFMVLFPNAALLIQECLTKGC